MNSENGQTPNLQNGAVTVNGLPIDSYGTELVYDNKRVFVLYAEDPENVDVQKRAKSLKKSWEKLNGKGTCEVAILKSDERVESLV